MDIPEQFVIRERDHRIHDPFGPEKLARLGEVLGLAPGARIIDLASGSGEMLCTWARDHRIQGVGVDLSSSFTDSAIARSIELGVSDAVSFEHGEAVAYVDTYKGERYDVASCLGATWIGDGPLGTVDLLDMLLKPGGLVLVGEPFWRETPPSEEAARGAHATSIDDFATLPELVRSFGEHGWDVVQMVLADPDDWDHYAAAQWLSTRRWLDENPGHELWQEMRDELDHAAYQHVAFTRPLLGWGVFALMRR
ncbi:SAM-dependent methyltransferase [Nocardioides sp. GXZ039]|uniref:SAM-dependent methyltransferase n=1 Tax=Nocardioides sp. GXZ039 TaxID=3136018 RepID=UPI0030F41738